MSVFASLWGGLSYEPECDRTVYDSLDDVVDEWNDRCMVWNTYYPLWGKDVEDYGDGIVGWVYADVDSDVPDHILVVEYGCERLLES